MNKCECKSCGKTWKKGEQGDNETLCLRCERESLLQRDIDQDHEDAMNRNYDNFVSERAYPASDDIWDEGY